MVAKWGLNADLNTYSLFVRVVNCDVATKQLKLGQGIESTAVSVRRDRLAAPAFLMHSVVELGLAFATGAASGAGGRDVSRCLSEALRAWTGSRCS